MKLNVFIYGLLIGLILSTIGCIWYYSHKDPVKQDVQTVVSYIEDKHAIDSITADRDTWKAQFYGSQDRINGLAKERRKLQESQGELILYADSLEREIALKKDTVCMQALTAKDQVIQLKDSIITSIDAEAQEYSRALLFAQNTIKKDSLIINKQAQAIDNLSCAYGWKVKHKFFAWLLGWECKKPPNQKK